MFLSSYLNAPVQPGGTPNIADGSAVHGPNPCCPATGRNSFRGSGYFDLDATV
jgi:hypothetical protein